ncbi:MAG: ABC transporter ATP-binding protein [Thermogemmatispora sp.]|jgi:branched-chain amino acid transport system ATP-binding protein|uniref:ABC transporter ATP-binding protein n=1 Tax=Thermogemmatispora TaxID=768669 RepID=UPI0008534482|nr:MULTISPECIES: ABC transporter ATP-binding protein [Thermogemmatispora]MBE3566273.1 ABC transporter ATP-binding protein [Thermogemmatispora sp.]
MLRVENLRAGYGPLEILHGVSLEVPTGSLVALLGANGAGKTTLMRTLLGLLPARSGRILFAGQEVQRASVERRVRLGLGLVPEGRELFPSLSVRENLLMGAFTRRGRAAIEADIERVLTCFPRLKERLALPAASLSGGESQMLAIGRALMSRPRLLLIDELSQGLAPAIVESVLAVLARLNRDEGLTILLVEQNARKALKVASLAYVLQSGSIVLQGRPADLAASPAIQHLYLGGEAKAEGPDEKSLDARSLVRGGLNNEARGEE